MRDKQGGKNEETDISYHFFINSWISQKNCSQSALLSIYENPKSCPINISNFEKYKKEKFKLLTFFCNADKHYYVDAVFSSWGTWNRLQDPNTIDSALIDPLDKEGCFEGFVLTWDPHKEKFACKSSDSQLEAICYSPPIVGNYFVNCW
jgi:hypothetical protein